VRGGKAVAKVEGLLALGSLPRSEAARYRCSGCGGKSLEPDGHPDGHGRPVRVPESRPTSLLVEAPSRDRNKP